MIGFGAREVFFNLGNQTDGLASDKNLSGSTQNFFEGDTHALRVHLRKPTDEGSSAYQLQDKETLALALVLEDDLRAEEQIILAYSNKFDEAMDEDGDICYETQWSLNTEEVITALGTRSNIGCVMELVILDELFGRQYTVQGSARIRRSAIDTQNIEKVGLPSMNIGSYSTVVSLAAGIVDERILGLKDGAPAEFDTLFELAESAMKVNSHQTQVGDFEAYLEGKAMANSGFTIVSLGQIAMDASTFRISHTPSRPKAVQALLYIPPEVEQEDLYIFHELRIAGNRLLLKIDVPVAMQDGVLANYMEVNRSGHLSGTTTVFRYFYFPQGQASTVLPGRQYNAVGSHEWDVTLENNFDRTSPIFDSGLLGPFGETETPLTGQANEFVLHRPATGIASDWNDHQVWQLNSQNAGHILKRE